MTSYTTVADCRVRSLGKGTRTQSDRLVQVAIISCLVSNLDNLGLCSVPVCISFAIEILVRCGL